MDKFCHAPTVLRILGGGGGGRWVCTPRQKCFIFISIFTCRSFFLIGYVELISLRAQILFSFQFFHPNEKGRAPIETPLCEHRGSQCPALHPHVQSAPFHLTSSSSLHSTNFGRKKSWLQTLQRMRCRQFQLTAPNDTYSQVHNRFLIMIESSKNRTSRAYDTISNLGAP